jgi:hypothetical protein
MCGDDVRLMTAGAGIEREKAPQARLKTPKRFR